MNGDILMKLLTIIHYLHGHVTLMTLRRLLAQKSRSATDGHRNLVNLIAPEPFKGFLQKHLHKLSDHELIRFPKVDVTENIYQNMAKITAEAYAPIDRSPSTLSSSLKN